MMDRAARTVAAAAAALFVVVGVGLSVQPTLAAASAGFAAIAVCVVLAIRATTGWSLVIWALVAAAGVTVVCHTQPSNLGWFTLCVLAGWCALAATNTAAVTFGGAMILGFVGQWLAFSDDPGWGAWVAGTAFTTIVCILARRQWLLLDQLRAAQAGLADRTRAEERNRIAAEMHDVIGHALTVSLLHVSSARLAIDEDPAEARVSLQEAERLARKSLEEVRATVGLMHSSSIDAAPLPGTADLEELVESFRRAGIPISLEVVGDPAALTSTSSLAVYRIVQEALTNVARHAPGSVTSVAVQIAPANTRVTVNSDGPPASRTTEGVGLLGMRERAETVGGHLTAGPVGQGWRVEAVLPA